MAETTASPKLGTYLHKSRILPPLLHPIRFLFLHRSKSPPRLFLSTQPLWRGIGNSNPLLYECKQCHGAQRIPHPMYRYQPKPGEFGTKTWSCEGPCNFLTWSCEGPCNFLTHWRIRHNQLSSIPVGDVPWPAAAWKALAQNRVLEARPELGVVQKSTCCIL